MKLGIREIIFVMLMVGMLGWAYYEVRREGTKTKAMEAEMAVKRKALADVRSSTSGIKDVEKKIEELQEAIKFFESKLPKEKEVDKILEGVTAKAKEHKLNTKTFKTMKIDNLAGYSEQPIQMTLSGDFKGYYAFLLDMEKLSRITRISQMKLNKINSRDGEMEAELTMSIYFERDQAGPRAASASAR